MPDFLIAGILVPVLTCLAVVLCALPARKIAILSGLVDHPGGRKSHEKPVAPVGGLIIFPIFMLAYVFAGGDLNTLWPFYVGLIILLVTGALDDRFSLPALPKFLAHFSAAALIVFFGNVQVAYLGDLFGLGVIWTGFMCYPFSIIAVVLLLNAVNLMDGLDGLAGGKSVVIFGWLALAALIGGRVSEGFMLLTLIGAIAGFLVFNMRNPWRRRACIFLGDSGSMCLGLAIAWFAVHLARAETSPLEPISVAWIIGFPIFDACAQFYRRVRECKDPFAPDRGHFHHHLIDAGFSVPQSTLFVMGIVGVMGLIGYGGLALGVPQIILTMTWIAALLGHIALSHKPARYIRILRRLRNKDQSQ
jgi:UDP-GlcNAc:undecaprenyl-phosphate/decaprenyl-phosphate GlcNAc-1-phosphate transferase